MQLQMILKQVFFQLFATLIVATAFASNIVIIQKPIEFNKEREELTWKYQQHHYGKDAQTLLIQPKMIVIHWTGLHTLNASFQVFNRVRLYSKSRPELEKDALNVSAHYLIDRDGTIYQLMPDNWMARHVIGLNQIAIGIENVGGINNKPEDLTKAQLQSNAALIRYLKQKYPDIHFLIGHYEYKHFENTPIWCERDSTYRTNKYDPGPLFMKKLRKKVANLHLLASYPS